MIRVGDLSIRPKKAGQPCPQVFEDRIVFDAEVEWRIKGPENDIADLKASLGSAAELVDDGLLFVGFGNSVGFFDLPYIGRIEVRTAKWTSKHFNRMLRELTHIAAALPFSAGIAASLT